MTTTPTAGSAWRRLAHEMAKFGTVGLSGVLVNIAVFNLCTHVFGPPPVRWGVLATLVAIGTNYLGYRYWVYPNQDQAARSREITLFLIFSAVGLVIENGTLYASHYWLGFTGHLADNIAK